MKLSSVKSTVVKIFTVGLLAGAVVIAAPTKAQAQVGIGVRIGPAYAAYGRPAYRRPIVVAPAPVVGFGFGYHPGFYGRPYGWDRREAFYRHEDRRFYHR